MDRENEEFLEFVRRMDLCPIADEESLKLLYNGKTSHVWEQLKDILLPSKIVDDKKDVIWSYQEAGGNVNPFRLDCTEYELSLSLKSINKKINNLQEELDDYSENDKLEAVMHNKSMEITELENRYRTFKNATVEYARNYVATDQHTREMQGYLTKLLKTSSLLHKIDNKLDYECCLEDVRKQQMKTIDNDKDTLDESLGILNLGDLEFQEDNEKDVKIDFEKCNLEFSNTTLFKFLDEDETRSNSCSKMQETSPNETNLKEFNYILTKELLLRKKYDLKCQSILKNIKDVTSLYDVPYLEVYENALQNELVNLGEQTNTINLDELQLEIDDENKHGVTKLYTQMKLVEEMWPTFNNITKLNNQIYKNLNDTLLMDNLNRTMLVLNKNSFNDHSNVLTEYLADTLKRSSNLAEDLKYNWHISLRDSKTSNDLIKYSQYTSLSPYVILSDLAQKKNFLNALKEKIFSYEQFLSIKDCTNDDNNYELTINKISDDYKNLLITNRELSTDINRTIKKLDLLQSLPFERYIPDRLSDVRENYLELRKKFMHLFEQRKE